MTQTNPAPTVRQERLEARDEVDEVVPGVLRLQIPIFMPGLGHVNCYLLEDDRGVTLVDPGLPDPDSHAALLRRLGSIGVKPERIHTVVVTHSHPDHFGGAGRLKVEHHADVVAHRSFWTPFDAPLDSPLDSDLEDLWDSFDPVEIPDDIEGPVNERLLRVLFSDAPIPALPPRPTPWGGDGFRPGGGELDYMRAWDDMSKKGLLSVRPTVRVDDEQFITLGRREWQVIHTPGHTGDHICLFDPADGVLLSGDHVLPTITPHISGLTESPDSLAEFVAALRRVASIEGVQTVLPAHGLVFDDLPGRVDAIIRHHEERLDLLETIGADLGLADVEAYSHRLFQERSWGPMAESETYAHLEHLKVTGRMTVTPGTDGRLRYELSSDLKSEISVNNSLDRGMSLVMHSESRWISPSGQTGQTGQAEGRAVRWTA